MNEVALQSLFEQGRLWRGQGSVSPRSALPTGFAALDEALPGGGWPTAALNEILLPADGVGEVQLLWPLLARLSAGGGRIVLVAPPYIPFAPAWAAAGIALPLLQIVQTDDDRNAMWVAEQCLRSAACAAVLCWPRQADSRTLRRLQLAAETGKCQGFAMRPANVATQPSMATLRILVEADPVRWRVLKCRGGNPPLQSVMPSRAAHAPSPQPSPLRGEGEKLATCAALASLSQPFPPSAGKAAQGVAHAARTRSAGGMLPTSLPLRAEGEEKSVRAVSSKSESGSPSVASEARLRDAGAQQAERTRQYVSIASNAGAQAGERSSLAGRS